VTLRSQFEVFLNPSERSDWWRGLAYVIEPELSQKHRSQDESKHRCRIRFDSDEGIFTGTGILYWKVGRQLARVPCSNVSVCDALGLRMVGVIDHDREEGLRTLILASP